ncbi:MAG TPA: acyl carrier protein [Candidatus Mediterraneibacter norfolkensis]|nr:acyl carrier protein [Candidatus Mediterraneibacter norfolkensis]
MDNLKKYNEIMMESFQVNEEQLKGLEYQSVQEWDSVGHMTMIAMLEEAFDIIMDTDDIIDFSSYEKGIEILKKYNIGSLCYDG